MASWVEELDGTVSRPVRKLISEVTFGVLSSGSLRQSDIARALKELPLPLKHSLFAGWQRLFAAARHIFYHWWRAGAAGSGDDPPIDDLFGPLTRLLPT